MKKNILSQLVPVYFVIIFVVLIVTVIGNRAVTTISEYGSIQNRRCIIIDAGHGGVDGGAVSCTGVFESTINLQIAQRLEDLFHLIGIKTLMIRSNDSSIYTEGESIASKKVSDLKNRTRIVNSTENAILVSIHQNYFTDKRYSGAQVFYTNNSDSISLAKQVQAGFIDILNPGSNRRAKESKGIYLMQHIKCTGILVECGFLSNPAEELKLRSREYQQNICAVIAGTCSKYLHSNAA